MEFVSSLRPAPSPQLQPLGFVLVESRLDCLLVAGTERGISFVGMGDDALALQAALHLEFPSATLAVHRPDLTAWAAALVSYLDGRQTHLDLPLDVAGTTFQRQVWEAVRRIPRGETRTYRQIAGALGRPGAARAVGRANATNPASIVIPCHRLTREDGSLAGYRWGIPRKRALLDLERRPSRELVIDAEIASITKAGTRHVECARAKCGAWDNGRRP